MLIEYCRMADAISFPPDAKNLPFPGCAEEEVKGKPRDIEAPFYVALPSPTLDWTVGDGVKEIPIEESSDDKVTFVQGKLADGRIGRVRISPEGSPAANPAFDMMPARLVTGLITERGIAKASTEGLRKMFPERG